MSCLQRHTGNRFLGKCSGVESDGATVVLTTLTFPVTLSCDQVPLPGEQPFEREVTVGPCILGQGIGSPAAVLETMIINFCFDRDLSESSCS